MIRFSFVFKSVLQRACAAAIILITAAVMAGPPREAARESDDHLPGKDVKKINDLTEKHDPAAVEAFLSSRPLMYHVYAARAYARAGLDSKEPAERERDCKKAIEIYGQVIALRNDPKWFSGESRHLDMAEWHTELADLYLRFRALPDLDRFEISSGLDFDRRRLEASLRDAMEQFAKARTLLDDLQVTMRTDEEKVMLLGLSEQIETLARRRNLSAAWASVYLAGILETGQAERIRLARDAVETFDAVAAAAKEPAMKYNALIGSGVALRQAGRNDEAIAAFEKVIASTAEAQSIQRARFEKARTLIASGRYEAARRELDAVAKSKHGSKVEGTEFYSRIAPIVRAYAFLLQSKTRPDGSPESQRLLDQARDAFQRVAEQGKEYEEIASVYLKAVGGETSDPARMSESDLRRAARRAMGEKKFDEAIGYLERLKAAGAVSDQFDLDVCLAQTGQTRRAAEGFAAIGASSEFAERAAEYAYRCRRDLAAQTKSKADYTALSHSAEGLYERYPGNPLAAEARWVAALAHQEAGDWDAAIKVYASIEPKSDHYWSARKNQARCMLLQFEGLSASVNQADRLKAAHTTADALLAYANDSDAAKRIEGGYSPRQARLDAASILARDDIRLYSEAVPILLQLRPDATVLGLRIKCFRGVGDLEQARASLLELLKTGDDGEAASAVQSVAADTVAGVSRLRKSGRAGEAKKAAVAGVSTLEEALKWADGSAGRRDVARALRQSLAELLQQSGRLNEAFEQLDKLMADEPSNGQVLLLAARIQEERADAAKEAEKPKLADQAETLWARLLEDTKLRDNAPAVYWEARYRWLGHQLRRGRSAEVVRAIETERAWYPELGGPPWQGLLLELADKARLAGPGS
ncbi:MAG TPA: tetratricopeptide repeat protein [Phycisphaerae bacterium]|nr:tetratricopeptide repeat protein [Phycisphaerae bacterium]